MIDPLPLTQSEPHASSRPAKSVRRRLVVAAVAIVIVAVLHRPLLRGAAQLLVVDQDSSPCDYLWIPAGDGFPVSDTRYLDAAAAMLRGVQGRRVLMISPPANRLVQMGVVPPFIDETRRQLESRGIAHDAIVVVSRGSQDARAEMLLLQAWLEEHSKARVVVFSDRFASRRARLGLDRRLAPSAASRIVVRARSNLRFEERTWWQSRDGIRDFLLSWIRLAYALAYDDQGQTPRRWTLEEYEERFLATLPQDLP